MKRLEHKFWLPSSLIIPLEYLLESFLMFFFPKASFNALTSLFVTF